MHTHTHTHTHTQTHIAVHTGHIANVGLSGQNMCSELECTGG